MQTKSLLNLSLVVVMLTGLSACQRSDDKVPISSPSETLVNSHAISAEEALSSLDNFLKDSPTRAAGSLPKVTDVIPMKLGTNYYTCYDGKKCRQFNLRS